MEEGCAWAIGILILVGITIAFIVYVVLPLSVFILLGIGIAGTVSGAGVALYNFYQVLIEAHKTLT